MAEAPKSNTKVLSENEKSLVTSKAALIGGQGAVDNVISASKDTEKARDAAKKALTQAAPSVDKALQPAYDKVAELRKAPEKKPAKDASETPTVNPNQTPTFTRGSRR